MHTIYHHNEHPKSIIANLRTFYRLAADYEGTGRWDLAQFLQYLTAMEEKGLVTAGENTTAGAVTIMSIHKSKGLEFPVVFLCGLSREFNRESLRAQVLCDKTLGLGLSVADTVNRVRYPAISKRAIMSKTAAESLSEEMRVLYVAMTRARDRLVMTYAARNLPGDVMDIALRYDICGGELLTRDVICPGEWVLLSALKRTEAGELHNLGGRPRETRISDYPWRIQVVQAPEAQSSGTGVREERREMPPQTEEKLREALEFRYGHEESTRAPSKQTATQRKGRVKDQEAAENAQEPKPEARSWRRPLFRRGETRGKAYGNAIHGVLQHIRYENCGSLEGVREEISRLAETGLITPEQAEMVNARSIARFFRSEIGQKLLGGAEHLREFKFSILDEGSHYGPGLDGEQVLLQGVVDLAVLEEDGITVVDFKTDYVTEENFRVLVERYRPQVEAYAGAMGRIYEMPVKAAYLYFFHNDQFVKI